MSQKKPHTPAFKIFHYYFQCYIAQHYVMASDFNATFGIPTTGSREVDRELANTKMRVQLTINEMTEYFHQGADITLVDQEDAVKIYEIVHAHLAQWKQEVHSRVSRLEIPVEDFRKLDAFAAELYRLAKGYMAQAPDTSSLGQKITQLESRRPGISRKTKEEKAETVPSEHQSMAEDIGKETFRRTNRYR